MAGFNSQTRTCGGNNNRMSAFNRTSVSYDGLGNLTGGVDATTFSFGANTRLAQIAEYSNDLCLTYNGLGDLARTDNFLSAAEKCGGGRGI